MTYSKFIIYLLLIGLTGYLLGLMTPDQVAERHIADQQTALNRVPTFRQLQRMVGAVEDGVIGPNTIALWGNALCNQYAIEAMERMAGDKK